MKIQFRKKKKKEIVWTMCRQLLPHSSSSYSIIHETGDGSDPTEAGEEKTLQGKAFYRTSPFVFLCKLFGDFLFF